MRNWGHVVIITLLAQASCSFAAQPPAAKPAAAKPPAQVTDVIRAKRIELTDDKGNVRVAIGLTSDGEAIIKLLDKDGNPTLALRSDQGLGILNEEGKRKIVVGSAGTGYGIGVYDSKGNPRAEITLVDDEPYMAMSDSNGKFRISMFLYKDQPLLSLSDGKGGGANVNLKVIGSAPRIVLSDATGKGRSEYSLTSDGAPQLVMGYSTGGSCLQLTTTNDHPSIDLIKSSGKPAATMGVSDNKGFFNTMDSSDNLLWQSTL